MPSSTATKEVSKVAKIGAKKVTCSARIYDDAERKAVLAWVATVANGGYSELDKVITMTYTEDPQDKDSNSRYWAIVHYFEQYAEHEITQTTV